MLGVIGTRGGRLGTLQRLILSLLLLVCTEFSRADWINLTGAETAPNIAEVYVLDDRVKVILEVYVGDLMAFEALLPDPWLRDLGVEPDPPSERLRRFSEEGLQLVTETGRRLQAEVALAEARLRVDRRSPYAGMINPVTRQPLPEAPEDKRVLYVELDYHFEQRPKSLTIVPPLDEEGYPTVDIGFITNHKSAPVIDFRYLGSGATLKLDWEDPWNSSFDNRNLKRHHKSALMSNPSRCAMRS